MSACPKCLRYDAWDGETCACCDNPNRHPYLRRLEMSPRLVGSLAAFYWVWTFWYGFPALWTTAAVFLTVLFAVAVYDRATGHRVLDWMHDVDVRSGRDAEEADEMPTGEGPPDRGQSGQITAAEPPAHPAGSLRVPGPAEQPAGTTPSRRRPGHLRKIGGDSASTPPPHARVAPGWRRFLAVLALSLTAGGLTAWATWTAWWWIVGADTP